MKKMLCMMLALMLLLCGFAMAETISPMNAEINPSEGTYPVRFKGDNQKDGVLNDVNIFTADEYAPEDIEKLAVGDELLIEGKTVVVKTLATNEFGGLDINGGFTKEDGYSLIHYEPRADVDAPDNVECWMSNEYDDYESYTLRGTFSLPLDENVTLTDSSDIDATAIEEGRQPLVLTGIVAVAERLRTGEDNDFYNEFNTRMVIRDGKIVEINRHYVP